MVLASQTFPTLCLATYYADIICRYIYIYVPTPDANTNRGPDIFLHYTIHCSRDASGHSLLLVLSQYPQNGCEYRGKMYSDGHPQLRMSTMQWLYENLWLSNGYRVTMSA